MAVTLAGRLRTQSGECARLGSPLYAELLARAAEDVEAGGVADWLERVLASPPPPGTQLTVVWHSVVWQYLGQQERERTEAALAAAAERARRGRGTPLACLALESRRVTDRYLFELRLEGSFLPAERLPVLALADGHGPPVRWWPEGPVALSPPPR